MKTLTTLFVVILTATTFAQTKINLNDFEISRQNINQNAMLILGSWAVGNILTGTYGNFKAKGEAKYFHQFNAFWNTVNLGLAVFGYVNAANSISAELSPLKIINDYNSLQNFLLLNAGLDVAYIMTGFYLKEKSRNSSKSDLLKGYGNSLLLQGGFLLVFDIALYFIHQNNAYLMLYPKLENILNGGIGLNLQYNF